MTGKKQNVSKYLENKKTPENPKPIIYQTFRFFFNMCVCVCVCVCVFHTYTLKSIFVQLKKSDGLKKKKKSWNYKSWVFILFYIFFTLEIFGDVALEKNFWFKIFFKV